MGSAVYMRVCPKCGSPLGAVSIDYKDNEVFVSCEVCDIEELFKKRQTMYKDKTLSNEDFETYKKATGSRKADGFSCPECGLLDHTEILASTEAVFVPADDPGISWEEIVRCSSCNTVHHYTNGA